MCAYSNGCVVQWNVKLDNKPEKVFYVDGKFASCSTCILMMKTS